MAMIKATCPKHNVTVNCNPNHYTKGDDSPSVAVSCTRRP